MNWRRSCAPRHIPSALPVDELVLTDRQWAAYLRALHSRACDALAAAQAAIAALRPEEHPMK